MCVCVCESERKRFDENTSRVQIRWFPPLLVSPFLSSPSLQGEAMNDAGSSAKLTCKSPAFFFPSRPASSFSSPSLFFSSGVKCRGWGEGGRCPAVGRRAEMTVSVMKRAAEGSPLCGERRNLKLSPSDCDCQAHGRTHYITESLLSSPWE